MSASEINQAMEGNLFELYRTIAEYSGRPMHADRFISWVNCAPSPWPYTIYGANFNDEDAAEKIHFVKDQIRMGNAPHGWTTGPSTRPGNLETLLLQEGFQKRWDSAGMGMELSDPPSDFKTPPGLEIETVADDATLREWARVVALGLFGSKESEVDYFYEVIQTVQDCDGLEFFLGRYKGQPVASATLFLSNGIAGIYHVATLPAFRRKGIGRSITRTPLLKAHTLSARAAVLQATTLGEPVYRQLGFQRYSTMGRFELVE